MSSNLTRWSVGALACATMLFGTVASASADSITQPGAAVGLAAGEPLPEGLFFSNTVSYGGFRNVDDSKVHAAIDIPAVVWSTPWTLFGGRVEVGVVTPMVAVDFDHGPTLQGMYNPYADISVAWKLGGGWALTQSIGGYAPVVTSVGANQWVFQETTALTYAGGGWNLTVRPALGFTGENVTTGMKDHPDYFNIDITATKHFGKWEVGAVGYGSHDLGKAVVNGGKEQAQFALGGLVGYNFGGVDVQIFATRDVFSQNYNNFDGSKSYETRIWNRIVLPLWVNQHEALK